jgi:pyrroline-5-carboxylate reductase
VKDKDKAKAKGIFSSVGEIAEVEEKLLDAVTGLSGSGPAFVYLFIEAMIEAGENLGLKKEVAQKLAVQTVLGAAETIKKTKKPTQELISMVTSPGGTTLAGLAVLDNRGFKQALIDAIAKAAARAKEISQEWN